MKKFGKHSELLKITDDSLLYVKDEIRKMNEESCVGKVDFTFSADFNERVKRTVYPASCSNYLNIGYFFLQYLMGDLKLKEIRRKSPYGIHS